MSEDELLQIIEKAANEGATELDLSGNELTSLPPQIGKLTKLKKLVLGKDEYGENGLRIRILGNQLTSLPREIGLLSQLEELRIVKNQLNVLPEEIEQLNKLKILDINENQLNSVPAEIGQLSNLQSLDLNSNKLSSIPAEIGQLSNLQSLDLNSNKLSNMPAEIGQLSNLQFLKLSRNRLNILPKNFSNLSKLQLLDLAENEIEDLVLAFAELKQLKILSLFGNKLNKLPSQIKNLINLQYLYLGRNKLEDFPIEINQITTLKELDLTGNQLTQISPTVKNLIYLEKLFLGDKVKFKSGLNLISASGASNNLSSLPAEIGQLSNLQSLDLSSNQLSSLPEEIGQLNNLQSLDLNSNQLSSLPAEIGQLSNLQSLILYGNQLSGFPKVIKQLSKLKKLDLDGAQISVFPTEIVQLKNLQSLDLRNNQLSGLPAEIGQLSNLQSLYLSYNQLSSLPAEIGQISNLKNLDLRGNPVPISPEILVGQNSRQELGDVKEILSFYFRVQDPKETESLYEAKFLIIGEGGAGKTSLAKKIEDENYQLKSDEKSTQGIDVIQWKFPLENGHEFRVNIWDFGGQEIYHQTHQFFLTKRSLYALVADDRRENTDFYWWLKVAELLSGNSPVLIIKNERQDRQCQVNERQLRGEFTNLKEVLTTNLGDAENRGLAEIKKVIQDYITRLPHVGTPLPKIWVRVRSAIENYSRNYISLEEFCQLCRVNNLTDREDMLRLSRYLHDLGVCLHFQDDATLKHYVILKPEWGTDAVYKVLDNSKVKQNLGCFTKNNLVEIWQDSQYAEMRDELLQLMMRFKLCYPIPNRPDHYIAPQLLDIEQPDYSWEPSQNLILRYKYAFMPKGILTRFIVETHPWIEQQEIVWQSGVVLNKDGTRAEVIENYNQKEIKVRVRGNRPKELLTVVNYELEKIHRSFERLQYQTLVPCNCSECAISENPYSYRLENLQRRLEKGRYEIECDKSYEMVNVRRLIEDVNLPAQERERELKSGVTPLQQELESDRKESINVTLNIQSGNTDQSRNVEIIGGEMNSSGAGAFNLGDISGTVANNNN